MTIGLVVEPWNEKRPSGLGRAVKALADALVVAAPNIEFIKYTKRSLGGGRLWLERLRFVRRADAYVFFTPVMPLFWTPPHAVVIAHDVGYFDVPVRGPWARCMRAAIVFRHGSALRRAWKVVAVSEATKAALIKHFNIPREKITVIYDGTNDFSLITQESVANIPQKFFLFAGVVKERKNVLTLIRAFAEYIEQGGTASLLIAGKCEGPYAEQVRTEASKLGKRVQFLGFVTDGQLAYLFAHTLAFTYPSLAEGFGMTIIEAMSMGAPVIASTDPAIKEVAGSAALLVDAYDTSAFAFAMTNVASDDAARSRLAAAGKSRAAEFSWHRAAEQLLALIR